MVSKKGVFLCFFSHRRLAEQKKSSNPLDFGPRNPRGSLIIDGTLLSSPLSGTHGLFQRKADGVRRKIFSSLVRVVRGSNPGPVQPCSGPVHHPTVVQRRHGPLPSRPRLLRLRRAGQQLRPDLIILSLKLFF